MVKVIGTSFNDVTFNLETLGRPPDSFEEGGRSGHQKDQALIRSWNFKPHRSGRDEGRAGD